MIKIEAIPNKKTNIIAIVAKKEVFISGFQFSNKKFTNIQCLKRITLNVQNVQSISKPRSDLLCGGTLMTYPNNS